MKKTGSNEFEFNGKLTNEHIPMSKTQGNDEDREKHPEIFEELINELPIIAWECDFSTAKDLIESNKKIHGANLNRFLHTNRVLLSEKIFISGGNKTAIFSHHFSTKDSFPIPIERFAPKSFSSFILDAISNFLEGKNTYEVITPQPIQFNGSKANWFKFMLHPDHQNSWLKVFLFFGDSDFSKQMKERIKFLNTILMYSANGIAITDIDARVLWVNPALCEMTGYSENEFIGNNISILKSGNNDRFLYQAMWSTILSGKIWNGELINKKKSGSLYNEQMTISPIKNDEGVITNFIAIKEDISLRNKVENEIKKNEEHYKRLYENAVFGIYRTTPEGKILMSNPALVKMLGFDSLDEFLKEEAHTVYEDVSRRKLFSKLIKENGAVQNFESVWLRRDGTHITVVENAVAIRNSDGEIEYYEGSVEDITSKKEAEITLLQAKEKAELSDKLKSEFLAQISHEIRTPVNAILSFTSLIKEELQGNLGEDLMTSFNVINRAGSRLIRTIDLILNMSEIQTGTYEFSPKIFNLYNDVLKKIYDEFASHAEAKNVKFELKNEADSCDIYADSYTVHHIFGNLIDNAIKYTSKGTVEVKLKQDEHKRVYVDITDTGIGISKAYLQNIFTPFSQEEQGYTRKFEGNGLGLALVKSYCDLNKAIINVESEKGIGSKFRVTFCKFE